jgi:geranylgeranyl pyrophosphate synthase
VKGNSGNIAAVLLAEARALTDARLARLATRLRDDPGGRDGDALAYALQSSGKGVRAALVFACYDAARGAAGASAPPPPPPPPPPRPAAVAAAVEIVHTYSLVHDDLPCMDDDAQRRGRPTLHVRFDVATATRVGLLLVPVAVEELCAAAAELGLSVETLGRMAALLLAASGIQGMVGGQWLDLEAEGRTPGLADLIEIHRCKTGALIEAACVLGGIAGAAPPPVLAALRDYGREIGLAFQIADDLLDATATSEQLGKTAGRDSTLAKATYVSVLGVAAARQEALRYADRARRALRSAALFAETLDGLADYIVQRRS